MSGNIFYRLDPLLICLVFMGVLLVAEELGFRVKGRTRSGSDSIEKADIALVLGAVLTLLALLLGFTYAMSEGRLPRVPMMLFLNPRKERNLPNPECGAVAGVSDSQGMGGEFSMFSKRCMDGILSPAPVKQSSSFSSR
jgi:hypothetical protein